MVREIRYIFLLLIFKNILVRNEISQMFLSVRFSYHRRQAVTTGWGRRGWQSISNLGGGWNNGCWTNIRKEKKSGSIIFVGISTWKWTEYGNMLQLRLTPNECYKAYIRAEGRWNSNWWAPVSTFVYGKGCYCLLTKTGKVTAVCSFLLLYINLLWLWNL